MISIVIPALNEEMNLTQTRKSVLSQSEPFEVILVDGGSQDRTRARCVADQTPADVPGDQKRLI